MTKILSFFIAIQFISLSLAQAFPTLPPKGTPFKFPPTFTADYNFEGIVALSNCSGSLIRFHNSKETDHAMVLTNGHCLELGMPSPGTFVYNEPSKRTFNLFDATAKTVGRLSASKIIYSTMTGTDITLYELQETFAEIIAKYKVHPFLLSVQRPKLSTSIQVISGFWQRGFKCTIDKFAYLLKEGDWTWRDSIRYSQPGCETIGGTSGSPIVEAKTRVVVGIDNTGNDNGKKCTFNNPCEVDENGNITFEKGKNYGQQTYVINSCVNSQGLFDLATPSCLLLRAKQYRTSKPTRIWNGPVRKTVQ